MNESVEKLEAEREEYKMFMHSLAISIITVVAASIGIGSVIGLIAGKVLAWMAFSGVIGLMAMINKGTELERCMKKYKELEEDIRYAKAAENKKNKSLQKEIKSTKGESFDKMLGDIERETEDKYGFKFDENEKRYYSDTNSQSKKR